MKNSLHLTSLDDSTARTAGRSCECPDGTARPARGDVPMSYRLSARLDPVHGCHAAGSVQCTVNIDVATYRLEGRVVVPFQDFESLGVDPQGGFDDEDVVLTITSCALACELQPARIEGEGVVFEISDAGTGLSVRRGDEVAVMVHGKPAATGVF